MVLKLKRRPVDTAPVLDPLVEIKALIDEIGGAQPEVDKILAKAKAMNPPVKKQSERLARLAELIEEVQSDPDQPLAIEGEKFKATAGKRATERDYLPNAAEKVRDMLGESQFMEVISIPLKSLDDYLTKAQRDEVLVEQRGKRGKPKIEALA